MGSSRLIADCSSVLTGFRTGDHHSCFVIVGNDLASAVTDPVVSVVDPYLVATSLEVLHGVGIDSGFQTDSSGLQEYPEP